MLQTVQIGCPEIVSQTSNMSHNNASKNYQSQTPKCQIKMSKQNQSATLKRPDKNSRNIENETSNKNNDGNADKELASYNKSH